MCIILKLAISKQHYTEAYKYELHSEFVHENAAPYRRKAYLLKAPLPTMIMIKAEKKQQNK